MHGALAVLVVTEGLDRQREQVRLLLGVHLRDLALGGAVDPRVRPSALPAVQIRLRLFDRLEAQTVELQLCVADSRFDLSLSIGMAHATGQCGDAVMRQHVAVERIERGIVDVGREHAFLQVVEHDPTRRAGEPAKRLLVQL